MSQAPAETALDEPGLCAYLEAQVDEFKGPLTATKFAGGQSNPTYRVEAASGTYVLRRKPPGPVLKSAHAVDREFRVISALANTDVPVPGAIHLCTDDTVIGSIFYLMGFVAGRTFWDAALPEVAREERPGIYDSMITTLAALHSVDINEAGLADYGKPGNYFDRQISRWVTQYSLSETEDIAAMNSLIDWLPDRQHDFRCAKQPGAGADRLGAVDPGAPHGGPRLHLHEHAPAAPWRDEGAGRA
jgi:aminoglycoside phosphotransferase (APT) family kinase protein